MKISIMFYTALILGFVFSSQLHGQSTEFKELNMKEDYRVARMVPVPPSSSELDLPYKIYIRDVLGDFETWENLHVEIGKDNLRYNINTKKRNTTLKFAADKKGWYPYKIFGTLRHKDGRNYTVKGSGSVYVGSSSDQYDLFASKIDSENQVVTAFMKKVK